MRSLIARVRATGSASAANEDVHALAVRLDRALGGGLDVTLLEERLRTVVAVAAARPLGRRGRLLYDVQKACVEAERTPYAVDVITFALSLGRRPVVRPLPAARAVRVLEHLRSATHHGARVTGAASLTRTLRRFVARAESNLRRDLAPKIVAVFDQVGFVPSNLAERVARRKVVEELLDAVTERGHIGLSQLRDVISRNALKLPDLRSPLPLLLGDALLRADALLAIALDGVYRRGEMYLRLLQKLSSIAFATAVGRFLVLYVVLPLGVSFVVLEGLSHIVGPIVSRLTDHHLHLATDRNLIELAVLVFAILHSVHARRAALDGVRAVGTGIGAVVLGVPRWIASRPAVRAVFESRAFRAVMRALVKPAVIAAVTWYLLRPWVEHPTRGLRGHVALWTAAALFVLSSVLLSTRLGTDLEEQATDWAGQSLRRVRQQFLPGLLALVASFFVALLELVERGLYVIDEWLRFREGQSGLAKVLKGFLGVIWFFVTYLIRLYVNVLIEPQVNPIKHFPVVTVSHKIVLPMSPVILRAIVSVLEPAIGKVAAKAIAAPTVLLIPGAFGFLVWELKENWKLYEANRPKTLQPALIGHHGETLAGLVRPGFHSGTVPKLLFRLRRAARRGDEGEVEKLHEALHHVEESMRRFVERELLAPLEEAGFPQQIAARALDVREVLLGGTCIEVTIAAQLDPAAIENPPDVEVASRVVQQDVGVALRLRFEDQSGWLLARVAAKGWLETLGTPARATFAHALAGFYARAGVDFVREDLEAQIAARDPAGATGSVTYDLSDRGLVLWRGDDVASREEIALDEDGEWRRASFGERGVTWEAWVEGWKDAPT